MRYILFKETIRLNQKLGFIIVIIGLILFFQNRLADFSQMNGYAFGILCGALASFIWIGYGLSQKNLIRTLQFGTNPIYDLYRL